MALNVSAVSAQDQDMPPAIRALMSTSHTELLVVNAYLIPDPKAFDSLRILRWWRLPNVPGWHGRCL